MRPSGSRPQIFPGWEEIRIFHPVGIYGRPAGSFLGGGGSFICGSSPLKGSRPKQKQIGEKVLLDLTRADHFAAVLCARCWAPFQDSTSDEPVRSDASRGDTDSSPPAAANDGQQ
jgi:hypothetical protein